MKRITVFCGSSFGTDDVYRSEAFLVGQTLARQGKELVYGGANVGLMGVVADGVLSEGGKATGVLPYFMQEKEIAHQGLTELILVDSMHERKTKMNELCDAAIALPGGFGTMEEFFEMLTWAQLGLHKKPLGLLNTAGFYDALLTLADTMVQQGFLKQLNRDMLISAATIGELLDKMHQYVPPAVIKWIDKESA